MIRATDPMASVFNATVDAAQRLAAIKLEETECLFKFHVGVARQLSTISAVQVTQWSYDSSSPVAGIDWPTLVRAAAERAGELTRNCAYAGAKAQSELDRLRQEQMSLISKIWRENIHAITTVAEAGGIAAFEPVEHGHKEAA
jgi:hypothetical protein